MSTVRSGAMDPALVFPFHLGPGLRNFTTPLLYGGGLVTTLPGYGTGEPEQLLFGALYDRAETRSHSLLPFLRGIVHHVRLAQKQALREMDALRPLQRRVKCIDALYPGTQSQYDFWKPLHPGCLGLAAASLANAQALNAACVEFMWRAFEYSLELKDDLDAVLTELASRAERLGSVDLLLAECALNRHMVAAVERARMATTIPETISILMRVAGLLARDTERDPQPPSAVRQVAFLLFNEVLAPHVPPLHGDNVSRIAELMEDRADELRRMRERCQQEALRLVECAADQRAERATFDEVVLSMQAEVADLLRASKRRAMALVKAVTESDSAWMVVATAAGSALATDSLGAAALGIAALSVLGAGALRVRREERAKVESSPWSFIYYVRPR